MNEENALRITGDLLATTPSAIGRALGPLFPAARIEVSTEVAIETDTVDIAIYPNRNASEGGSDFLLTGHVYGDEQDGRDAVRRILSALGEANIAYSIEVWRESDASERVKEANDRFAVVTAARRAAHNVASTANITGSLDGGRIVIGDRLRSGTGDEVRAGWLQGDPAARCLITLTGKHSEKYTTLRQSLELPVDGIAPLEFIGTAGGTNYQDALVERIAGDSISAPIDASTVARLGAEAAATTGRVHSSGAWLGGIRPELVFAEKHRALLAPRGPRFIAATPLARGMRSYSVPYMSPEELLSSRGGQASDVFSLCATLYYFGTGRHPFGDATQVSALVARMSMGAPDAWPDGGALAQLLAIGMRTAAGERPTAKRLAEQLSKLA